MADLARFDFDEVPQMHMIGEDAGRAHAGVGSDAATRADGGVFGMGKSEDLRVGADCHVAEHAIGADARAIPQHHTPVEHAVDVDRHVAAAHEFAAHVDACRIGQRHTLLEQRVCNVALMHPLQFGQLDPAVDPFRLPLAVRMDRVDRALIRNGQTDDVGEVVLALRVVVGDSAEPALERRSRGDQDAGVHLTDRALFGRRVFVFDDADHASVAAHDAAIAGRIAHLDRQQRHGAFRRLDQSIERGVLGERHVAVQHQRRPAIVQMRDRLLHRMAGAQLRLLLDPLDRQAGQHRMRGHGVAYGLAAVSVYDDDLLRMQVPGRHHHVAKQRDARQRMQHLRAVGLHALALSGSEDDDVHGEFTRVRGGLGFYS